MSLWRPPVPRTGAAGCSHWRRRTPASRTCAPCCRSAARPSPAPTMRPIRIHRLGRVRRGNGQPHPQHRPQPHTPVTRVAGQGPASDSADCEMEREGWQDVAVSREWHPSRALSAAAAVVARARVPTPFGLRLSRLWPCDAAQSTQRRRTFCASPRRTRRQKAAYSRVSPTPCPRSPNRWRGGRFGQCSARDDAAHRARRMLGL